MSGTSGSLPDKENATEALAPADLLVHLETWILNRLEHLEHRGYSDCSGHPHGGAVAYIPEWELRQKLDEIRASLELEREMRKGRAT